MPAPLGGRARAEARLRAKQKVKVKPKAKPKSYTLPRSFSTERAASPKVKAPRKSPSKGAGSGYRLPKDFRPADTGTDNIRLAGKKAKRDVRTGSVTWRKEMRSVGRGGKLRVKRRTETNRDVNTAIHRIRQRQAFKQLNDYAAEQVGSKKKPDYAGAKRLRKVVTREATGMNRRIQAEEARQRKAARDRERAAARRIKVIQDREKEERSGGGVGGIAERFARGVKDVVKGAPAAAVETAKAAKEMGDLSQDWYGRKLGIKRWQKDEISSKHFESVIKGVEDTSPVYGFAKHAVKGKIGKGFKEAGKRLNENPVTVFEVTPLGRGVTAGATKARHGSTAAGRARASKVTLKGQAPKSSKAEYKRQLTAAREVVKAERNVAKVAKKQRKGKASKGDLLAARDRRRRAEAAAKPRAQVGSVKQRQYSRRVTVRAVQKGRERVQVARGKDPNVAVDSKRALRLQAKGGRKAAVGRKLGAASRQTTKLAGQTAARANSGGLALEVDVARNLGRARRQGKKFTTPKQTKRQNAAVRFMHSGEVRRGREREDLEDIRDTLTAHVEGLREAARRKGEIEPEMRADWKRLAANVEVVNDLLRDLKRGDKAMIRRAYDVTFGDKRTKALSDALDQELIHLGWMTPEQAAKRNKALPAISRGEALEARRPRREEPGPPARPDERPDLTDEDFEAYKIDNDKELQTYTALRQKALAQGDHQRAEHFREAIEQRYAELAGAGGVAARERDVPEGESRAAAARELAERRELDREEVRDVVGEESKTQTQFYRPSARAGKQIPVDLAKLQAIENHPEMQERRAAVRAAHNTGKVEEKRRLEDDVPRLYDELAERYDAKHGARDAVPLTDLPPHANVGADGRVYSHGYSKELVDSLEGRPVDPADMGPAEKKILRDLKAASARRAAEDDGADEHPQLREARKLAESGSKSSVGRELAGEASARLDGAMAAIRAGRSAREVRAEFDLQHGAYQELKARVEHEAEIDAKGEAFNREQEAQRELDLPPDDWENAAAEPVQISPRPKQDQEPSEGGRTPVPPSERAQRLSEAYSKTLNDWGKPVYDFTEEDLAGRLKRARARGDHEDITEIGREIRRRREVEAEWREQAERRAAETQEQRAAREAEREASKEAHNERMDAVDWVGEQKARWPGDDKHPEARKYFGRWVNATSTLRERLLRGGANDDEIAKDPGYQAQLAVVELMLEWRKQMGRATSQATRRELAGRLLRAISKAELLIDERRALVKELDLAGVDGSFPLLSRDIQVGGPVTLTPRSGGDTGRRKGLMRPGPAGTTLVEGVPIILSKVASQTWLTKQWTEGLSKPEVETLKKAEAAQLSEWTDKQAARASRAPRVDSAKRGEARPGRHPRVVLVAHGDEPPQGAVVAYRHKPKGGTRSRWGNWVSANKDRTWGIPRAIDAAEAVDDWVAHVSASKGLLLSAWKDLPGKQIAYRTATAEASHADVLARWADKLRAEAAPASASQRVKRGRELLDEAYAEWKDDVAEAEAREFAPGIGRFVGSEQTRVGRTEYDTGSFADVDFGDPSQQSMYTRHDRRDDSYTDASQIREAYEGTRDHTAGGGKRPQGQEPRFVASEPKVTTARPGPRPYRSYPQTELDVPDVTKPAAAPVRYAEPTESLRDQQKRLKAEAGVLRPVATERAGTPEEVMDAVRAESRTAQELQHLSNAAARLNASARKIGARLRAARREGDAEGVADAEFEATRLMEVYARLREGVAYLRKDETGSLGLPTLWSQLSDAELRAAWREAAGKLPDTDDLKDLRAHLADLTGWYLQHDRGDLEDFDRIFFRRDAQGMKVRDELRADSDVEAGSFLDLQPHIDTPGKTQVKSSGQHFMGRSAAFADMSADAVGHTLRRRSQLVGQLMLQRAMLRFDLNGGKAVLVDDVDLDALEAQTGQRWAFVKAERLKQQAQPHIEPEKGSGHELFEAAREGDMVYVIPEAVREVWAGQMRRPTPLTGGAQFITRHWVGAVLPFSVAWHVGNFADQLVRTLSLGPMQAAQGALLMRHLRRQIEAGDLPESKKREILSFIQGHFAAQADIKPFTLEEAFSRSRRLASVGRAITGKTQRQTYYGPRRRAIARLMGKPRDVLFGIGVDFEKLPTNVSAGAAARAQAKALGIDTLRYADQAAELVRRFDSDPAALDEFQRRTLETIGDFTHKPWERDVAALALPFISWMREAARWTLWTIPKNHPYALTLAAIASNATREQRAALGLEYWHTEQEHYRMGNPKPRGPLSMVHIGGKYVPVGHLFSTGEAGGLLDDPAAWVADKAVPWLQGPVAASLTGEEAWKDVQGPDGVAALGSGPTSGRRSIREALQAREDAILAQETPQSEGGGPRLVRIGKRQFRYKVVRPRKLKARDPEGKPFLRWEVRVKHGERDVWIEIPPMSGVVDTDPRRGLEAGVRGFVPLAKQIKDADRRHPLNPVWDVPPISDDGDWTQADHIRYGNEKSPYKVKARKRVALREAKRDIALANVKGAKKHGERRLREHRAMEAVITEQAVAGTVRHLQRMASDPGYAQWARESGFFREDGSLVRYAPLTAKQWQLVRRVLAGAPAPKASKRHKKVAARVRSRRGS
jgi:hypothetical protein